VPLQNIESYMLVNSLPDVALNEVVGTNGVLHFPDDEGGHGTNYEWLYVALHFTTRNGNTYTCTVSYINPYYPKKHFTLSSINIFHQ
jgi:hypothetical protein